MLVVITLISALVVISARSLNSYSKASMHKGAVRQTVAILRNAQIRAVTEAISTECRLSASKLDIYKSGTLLSTYSLPSYLQYVFTGSANGKLHGFTHPGEAAGSNTHTNCFFYAKGTATPGLIGVKRLDNSKELYVEVEGLTARVSYCADPAPSNPCPA